MKVIIFGATGYIGGAIAQAMASGGHQVVGVARSDRARTNLIGRGIGVVEGDVGRPDAIASAVSDAEAIVYAVAITDADPAQIDTAALRSIVDAAQPGAALLYASSTWVYGDTDEGPVTEDASLSPPPLAAARPGLERIVVNAAVRELRSVVIRGGLAYGNGGGIPAMFATSARQRGAAMIVGEGKNRWACVHVDDLADCFTLALKNAKGGSVYNAVDPSSFTVGEIAAAAARGAGARGRTATTPAAAMGQFGQALTLDQRISAQRASDDLGWKPKRKSVVEELERGSYAPSMPEAIACTA
jgi:nucleoside-diphosphate-sugar epimerase